MSTHNKQFKLCVEWINYFNCINLVKLTSNYLKIESLRGSWTLGCKSTETGPPQRRQQVKVVEWLFINIFIYMFVCCCCARFVYNMNVYMHIKLIVPRPHCANTKETKSTSISRSQRLFQVHGNWSRFGANLWTRRWLSSIPHKLKLLAAVSFV